MARRSGLAAAAGLAPLAFGVGAGSEMQQPLAIAILGGVSLSMLFSLLGVPLLYRILVLRGGPGDRSDASAARRLGVGG